jgi:hypothetical protein
VRRLSEDAVLDAREALALHVEQNKPMNNMGVIQNDYTKSPTLWNGPVAQADRVARRHAELAAAQVTAKPAPPQPTVEENHQELVQRRRENGGVQKFNRKSFK